MLAQAGKLSSKLPALWKLMLGPWEIALISHYGAFVDRIVVTGPSCTSWRL